MPRHALHHLLLLQLGALLLAVYASPVAAGDRFDGGGRMIVVRAASSVPSVMWRRRLEDEVAPEFPVDGLLGRGIDPGSLTPDKSVCLKREGCAAKCHGCPYTRPCLYLERCPQGHD